ncbi:GGDEF domain-containing protein [Nocardiopsis sp. CNT-189]|uniref:GGDEF domain-containing protein n=1 Tax=Nocardiopsis oceanisediminis TaxID=2816862 RepID=UPI003B36B206
MGAVSACALAAAVLALLALPPVRAEDLLLFGGLVLCAALCVEGMRRLGSPQGVTRDLFGAWWFPTLLLLPPAYALLIPAPVYLLLQYRIRRIPAHRRTFNAASVGLAGAAASWVFHLAAADAAAAGGPAGAAELLATPEGVLAGVAACVLFTVVNTGIIATAVRLSGGGAPLRMLCGREAVTVAGVEICAGLTAAVLAGLSTPLLVLALPPVLMLQRSLLFEELQAAARNDPKTGLLNATTWEKEAELGLQRARRENSPAAVLIVDIDHFKRVNDTYGHLVGDEILQAVADTLGGQLRTGDLIGRFGGEEFVVLLSDADMAEACRVAERLRYRVGLLRPPTGQGEITITVSVGIALLPLHGETLVDLLTIADLALYRAKDEGRDRVRLPVAAGPAAIPGQKRGEDAVPECRPADPAVTGEPRVLEA